MEEKIKSIRSPKDCERSAGLKLAANKLFASSRYLEALAKYNESLLYAEPGTEALGVLYANRSACFLKLKEFQHCLNNIELARSNHYPADKMDKLSEREVVCKEAMETHKPNPDDDPWNFFKMTQPPNPKLPFLANCLELHVNKKYGRHIVTNRDLRAGDIIAVTESFFKVFDVEACLHSCSYCVKNSILFDLIPCSGCTEAMYCSDSCMNADKKEFHQYVCNDPNAPKDEHTDYALLKMLFKMLALFDGDISELRSFLEENEQERTVFDFDFSDRNDPMYQKHMMLASLSIKNAKDKSGDQCLYMCQKVLKLIEHNTVLSEMWEAETDRGFLVEILLKLFTVYSDIKMRGCYAEYEFYKKSDDRPDSAYSVFDSRMRYRKHHTMTSVDQVESLMNHSCLPNIEHLSVDNKLAVIVIWPIKKGEQLFRHYIETAHAALTKPKDERKKELMDNFGFECDCIACVENYPVLTTVAPLMAPSDISSVLSVSLKQPSSRLKKATKEAAQEFFKCADVIDAKYKSVHIRSLWHVVALSLEFLAQISYAAPWFAKKREN